MGKNKIEHAFVVCAYKESPYLEECIQSLINQQYKSDILIVTSTPNEFIKNIANKYELPLYINEGQGGIVQDWNFGYSKAESKYVTIAHQDDVYYEDYSKSIIHFAKQAKNPLIFFSDYAEIREGKKVENNQLLMIKKIMLSPLRNKHFWTSKFVRRRILSFGNPICCPAVTMVKEALPKKVFTVGFRSDEDWEAWEKLSSLRGSFVYINRVLMGHRIHEESETSIILGDNARREEDFIMFTKFWPKWIAKIICKFYAKSEQSNQL